MVKQKRDANGVPLFAVFLRGLLYFMLSRKRRKAALPSSVRL